MTLYTLQASITWKQCADLPMRISFMKTTVINGKVYCGGGVTIASGDIEYIIYCYDPSQDKWTTLPPLPVKWFGLGQINGKLVAVGGEKKNGENKINDVYTYDERYQMWKQTIPPMPTARGSPGVLSFQSALIVASGNSLSHSSYWYVSAVEIFKPDTSQWYRTDPLPEVCCDISLVAIGNTCYALGGNSISVYATVDDLLGNAVPANQTPLSGSSGTQSAWKTLPNTPTFAPAAAVLAGNLLAIGGFETSKRKTVKKAVYMYSPSTNSWIYISDLPAPRAYTAIAILPSAEVLVIGGSRDCNSIANTVYKGTLTLL